MNKNLYPTVNTDFEKWQELINKKLEEVDSFKKFINSNLVSRCYSEEPKKVKEKNNKFKTIRNISITIDSLVDFG